MANKKISELDSRASLSLSDLLAVGDPTTGYLYKITITDLKSLTGAGVISFNGRVGAVSPAEGDYSLTQLGDVIITSPSNNQYLQYNGSNWVNATLDLSGYVTLAGSQTITGTKTFAPAHSNGVNAFVAGGFAASQVKVTYGANVNDMTFSVGDSFSVVRIGTGVPAMYGSLGLNFFGSYLGIYGTYNGTANPPGEIRLAGNYGFGTAAIGAYNTAVSSLTFGNSYNSYQYNQIVYARNMVWMHNDASTQPSYSAAAIMNLQSTTKGFVMPRMTTAQRDAIASPIAGLEVYNSSTNKPNYYNGSAWVEPGAINSITFTAPTGFSVLGSPLTSSGTIGLSFAAGYSLPTTVKQSNWDDAYTFVAAFPSQTGNSGKYLTTDGSALSWATVSSYSLPIATASVLGGVKIGSGVSIDAGGVISVSTNYQAPLSGTGFVKISGSTISYDNSTYLTTTSAASTYLALSGGTLTGVLTAQAGVVFNTSQSISTSGSIGFNSAVGVFIYGKTGSEADFRLYNASGLTAMSVIAGTQNVSFNGNVSSKTLNVNAGTTDAFSFGLDANSTFAFGSTNGRRLAVFRDASQTDNGLQFGFDATDKTGIIAGSATNEGTGIDFYTYNGNWANRARLTKDGNFGVGTNTVNSKVHIVTSSGAQLLRLEASGVNTKYVYKLTGGADDEFTLFRNHPTGGNLDIMTWSYSGNVNIGGAVSGGGKLQVNGDVNINGSFKINGTIIGGGGGSGVTGSGTTNTLTKWTGSTTLGNSIMSESGGNVNVSGGVLSNFYGANGTGSNSVGAGPFITLSNNSNSHQYLTQLNAGFGLDWWAYTGSWAKTMILTNVGNLLVGAGADLGGSYRLQVNGAISMAYGFVFNYKGSSGAGDILVTNTGSTLSIGGNTTVSGSITATAFFESSDIRFKNVLEYNPSVNVSGIDVIKFTRKSDSQIRYGYSAQQVQSIFPDAVMGKDELVVNYIDIHTLKIAKLEQRVAELEAQLNN